MDDHFGSKLEQARTRQGISIREASDATKIRADFLLGFENDHGAFDMPEIYKKGFLKLYARYLKLDPEEIVKDYLAYHNFEQKKSKNTAKESLGRIQLKDTEPEVVEEERFLAQSQLPLQNNIESTRVPSDPESSFKQTAHFSDNTNTRSLYLKIGLMFGGGLVAIILLGVLLTSIFRSSSNDDALNEGGQKISKAYKKVAPVKNDFVEELTLIGDEEVKVLVRQENDKEQLFSGQLQVNKPISITRKGPVKIQFSEGNHITIQRANGERIRPGGEGRGWIEI